MSSKETLECLLRCLEGDVPVAAVTIVDARGSIPNAVGAKMIVGADGRLWAGTIGGGEVEREAMTQAALAINEGKSRTMTYSLTEKAAHGLGMLCGGTAQIFIEVFKTATRLILVGGGHVNIEVAKLARGLGLSVTVIDHRPEWANAEHYPGARLIAARPRAGMAQLDWRANDYLLIATADADTEALACAATLPCAYVGLVASKRKTLQILRNLEARGVDLTSLRERLRSPVGLNLGGKTPAELALSIMAEIQAHRNGQDARPLSYVEHFRPQSLEASSVTP